MIKRPNLLLACLHLAISLSTLINPNRVGASDPLPIDIYDTHLSVPCKELARTELSKTIVAEFRFSIRTTGTPALDELEIHVDSPEKILRVVSFLPQTTLDTNIVDGEQMVSVTSRKEASLNGKASGNISYSGVKSSAKASVDVGVGEFESVTTTTSYKQLSPREMILASGTSNRGHGVFFKLKRTDRHPLEGEQRFICVFEVVPTWRCDYLQAKCKSNRSNADFLIGIFMEKDTEAKFLVEKAAQINEQLKPIENQLTDVKSSSFFPYFGLGSQAAGIDSKLSVLRSEYNTTLQNIRLLNLQVESDPE
jgi:hypothetical protein